MFYSDTHSDLINRVLGSFILAVAVLAVIAEVAA